MVPGLSMLYSIGVIPEPQGECYSVHIRAKLENISKNRNLIAFLHYIRKLAFSFMFSYSSKFSPYLPFKQILQHYLFTTSFSSGTNLWYSLAKQT